MIPFKESSDSKKTLTTHGKERFLSISLSKLPSSFKHENDAVRDSNGVLYLHSCAFFFDFRSFLNDIELNNEKPLKTHERDK